MIFHRSLIFLVVIVTFFGCSLIRAQELVVRHIQPEAEGDTRSNYYLALLALSLKKTEAEDGPFRLEMSVSKMNQSRALKQLKLNSGIDVVWTMASEARETAYLPIRIPLLKGLLGHRIFIIREEDAHKFAAINSISELKSLRVGQAANWPDANILKANGFDVVGGVHYEGLFDMLERGRFDYFPRGLNEPWAEVRARPDKGFMVEETLLIQYPAPIYFFVSLQNKTLANRIERGLKVAILDGSFDRIFKEHPISKEMFDSVNINKRRVFHIDNPYLTADTPLENSKLWYQVK